MCFDSNDRFLRRRYKHLKQDQTLETSPNMLRLSESGGDVKVTTSGKRKKHSGPCFDLKRKDTVDNARSRGNEVLTPLPDLNDNTLVVSSKVSGFDLNLVSVKLKQLVMMFYKALPLVGVLRN